MCAALLRSVKLVNLRPITAISHYQSLHTSNSLCKWRNVGSGEVERKLLSGDSLPDNYKLIYRAPIESYVTWTKNMSTATTSILGLVAAYHWATTMNFVNTVQKMDIAILVSQESDLYYFLTGFVLINLAIRAFVAKYPLRIYKSSEKYVAVYGSQLPLGTVKHYFERGQIAEYKNFLNPWRHIMYKLGDRSSMLLVDYFKTPSEFHQLFETKQET
ncbi:uncharacterized protein LOC108039905 [Drosophila rhopaloa]|uniref:Uncharacterized protein LOC108039905 n=1 Tax=Drosophila rhopaloa TaxID=1041015 RepID=A0A6P4EH00_DRORH|nr:uncharacterized protein LOC108039905 [Drosophila rhopaloa]